MLVLLSFRGIIYKMDQLKIHIKGEAQSKGLDKCTII